MAAEPQKQASDHMFTKPVHSACTTCCKRCTHSARAAHKVQRNAATIWGKFGVQGLTDFPAH